MAEGGDVDARGLARHTGEVADATLDADRGEVLDSGPRERGPRRRLTIVVTAVLLVVAGVAVAVDQHTRRVEERAIATCSARAVAAVRDAWSPVVSMTAYVRPVLDAEAPSSLRHDMERLVRAAARGRPRIIAAVSDSCDDVVILGLHASLRHRRDACVDALTRHEEFLTDLADGGLAVTDPWPPMLTGC